MPAQEGLTTVVQSPAAAKAKIAERTRSWWGGGRHLQGRSEWYWRVSNGCSGGASSVPYLHLGMRT